MWRGSGARSFRERQCRPEPNSTFGLFELDARSRELRKNGHKIRLRFQPFQLLVMLLESPGEVVTREALRSRLWPIDTFVDFDHGLNAAIKRLRDALGDSAENPRFVETLARQGYRFIAAVDSPTAIAAATHTNGSGNGSAFTQGLPKFWICET